jgi:hypothetical protein
VAGARLTNTHRDGELVKATLELVGLNRWIWGMPCAWGGPISRSS